VALLGRSQKFVTPGLNTSAAFRRSALASLLTRTLGLILFTACSLLLAGSTVEPQSQPLSEDEIKTGFLFNFTKFVEWPSDAFANPGAPMVLGMVGDGPVADLLSETAAGKTVNGRAVVVLRFKEGQDLRNCQILFVNLSERKRLPQILEHVKGSPVLTVGETGGFVQSGGMINFYVEDNRVRLEINLDATARARVKISAKLIAVARLVTGDLPGSKN
jgi:YfiR/HmsC-like